MNRTIQLLQVQDQQVVISGYFSTCEVALEDDKLKRFLQEHLGHILMETDFDAIATQIQHQIESLVIPAASQSLGSEPPPASTNVTAHVPTEALKELFQSQLAEFCSEAALEQLIQFSHQSIHKAVLRPRHTWSSPIWVLRGETPITMMIDQFQSKFHLNPAHRQPSAPKV